MSHRCNQTLHTYKYIITIRKRFLFISRILSRRHISRLLYHTKTHRTKRISQRRKKKAFNCTASAKKPTEDAPRKSHGKIKDSAKKKNSFHVLHVHTPEVSNEISIAFVFMENRPCDTIEKLYRGPISCLDLGTLCAALRLSPDFSGIIYGGRAIKTEPRMRARGLLLSNCLKLDLYSTV